VLSRGDVASDEGRIDDDDEGHDPGSIAAAEGVPVVVDTSSFVSPPVG
jgi:hypothetical protein